MTDQESGFARLQNLLGAGFLAGAEISERYTRDWSGDYRGQPAAVLRPAKVEDVASAVRICREAGFPIIPQGGHTGLVGGATPDDPCQVVMNFDRMNHILNVDSVGMTMTVQAGCILQQVKDAAAEIGCLFPLSLGAQGSCQIGGNIATNAGGLNVLRYGMTRASILGIEAVLSDGSIFRDLRPLRKNNTGLDLKQLFIGTEGTLGIVTAATLKLQRQPRRIETIWFASDSVERVMELYATFQSEAGDFLSAFELVTAPCLRLARELDETATIDDDIANSSAHALVEISSTGGPDLREWVEELVANALNRGLVTNGVMAQTTAQARSLWRIRELMVEAQQRRGAHLRTDVSVPVSNIPSFIAKVTETLTAQLPGIVVLSYGHIGDGNVHVNALPPSDLEQEAFRAWIAPLTASINDIVDVFGGSISAEHGIGLAKRAALERRLPKLDRELMLKIKNVFDPQGQFSPRRIHA